MAMTESKVGTEFAEALSRKDFGRIAELVDLTWTSAA
jgi:hypothetical protein